MVATTEESTDKENIDAVYKEKDPISASLKLRAVEGSITSIVHEKRQPYYFTLELEGAGLILDSKDKKKNKKSMREGMSLEKKQLYSQTNSSVSAALQSDS